MQNISTDQAAARAATQRLRDAASSRLAHPRRHRLAQLEALGKLLEKHGPQLEQALREDLGKDAVQSRFTEIGTVQRELEHAKRHLEDWMHTRPVPSPFAMAPATTTVTPRPLGMVLVIAPWNYPINLTLTPVVSALAAGNTVVIKPSELAPATAALLAELIPQYLDHRVVAVVNGGAEVTQELLGQKFDHIFYTGGERVGRIVYEAAAKQLTPVTLELGGKCPAVVVDGDVKTLARRIAFAKFTNAGQTCVAPDYVLAVGSMADKLAAAMPGVIEEFYGADPSSSKDFGRIVTTRHAERLVGLMEGGRALTGGDADVAERYVAPTVLTDVDVDSELMREEIFGPLLPIIPVRTLDEALRFIGDRPDPLAAYVFSERHGVVRAFEDGVRAGAVGVNAALLHLAVPELPFGGVGASGMGAYHGRTGFETFSQQRPTFGKSTRVDTLKMVYPPYGAAKAAMLKRVL